MTWGVMTSGLPASAGHGFAGCMGLRAADSHGFMSFYPHRAERDCSHASCSLKLAGVGEDKSGFHSSQGPSLGLPKRKCWGRANKAPHLVRTIISYKSSLEQPSLITQPTSIHAVMVSLMHHRSITSHTEAAERLYSICRALLRTYLRNLFRSPCFMYSKTMMSGSPSPQTP